MRRINMKLITESSYDVRMYEDEKDKSLKIVGIFSSAEIENGNGRVYPRSILEREINKITEKINNKCLFGELSHPTNPSINPERISHIVESLEWKNNDVYGKAKILNTPMGKITKELIKEGRIGISSRGLGTVSEGKVNDDYNLLTYDIVLDASNPGSRYVNGIYEGEEFEYVRKPLEEDIKKAQEAYKRHVWQVLEKISKKI
jgi:hypothetical protein